MSPTKKPVFAFDWDGTLVDCRARQLAVLASILNELAATRRFDLESIWQCKREGMNTCQALQSLGLSNTEAAIVSERWQQEIEQPRWLEHDAVLPDAYAALEKTVVSGFFVVVMTARAHPLNVQNQIAGSVLSRLIGAVEVVSPDHAVEEKAAGLCQLEAQAFIGDSESDFKAAELAKVSFAGVGCGQRSLSCLTKLGVTPLFPDTFSATVHLLNRVASIKPK